MAHAVSLAPHNDEDDDFVNSFGMCEIALRRLDVNRISDPKVKDLIMTIEETIGTSGVKDRRDAYNHSRQLTFEQKLFYSRAVRDFCHWLDKEFHWRDEHRNWF